MRRAPGLVALVVAAAVGGCGTAGVAQHSGGQALFAQDCGVCHSLSGQQVPPRDGGDLLALRVGREAMLQFVREMPVSPRLRPAQLRAVADYVLAVERRRGSG
jgi:mono/diheme cytochrome c family protein